MILHSAVCSAHIDTSVFTYIVRTLISLLFQSYGVRDIAWTFLGVPARSSFSYLSFILLSFSFSFRYINTRILYGENLRPPKRIVAPFSVWPLAVLPVHRCLVIIPGSDTDIGCVDTPRKMPWILSVFEIRTRTPADPIESWWLRRIPSTSHFVLSLLSFSRLFILYVHPCIYKSTTSDQAFFSVLSLSFPLPLTISLTDYFPFSFSHRNFPAMYFVPPRTFRSWYSHLVYLPGKSDSATKKREYRMRMLSTASAHSIEANGKLHPSFFLPPSKLLDTPLDIHPASLYVFTYVFV